MDELTEMPHRVQDAIRWAQQTTPECYSIWKHDGNLKFDDLVLLDVSEKLSISVQPTRADIGKPIRVLLNEGFRSDECPIAPKWKEVLGIPLSENEVKWLKYWHQSSDGELYLNFEGVLRVSFAALPGNFLVIRFYRVFQDPSRDFVHRWQEQVGYCLWDLFDPQVLDGRPRPETAPMQLIFTNELGCRFFGTINAQGKTMEELCPLVYETEFCQQVQDTRRTHKPTRIIRFPVLKAAYNPTSELSRAADNLYDIEIIPTSSNVVLVLWRDVSSMVLDRAAQQRLTVLLNAAPSLCLLARPQGSVMYLNSAGRQLAGIGEKDSLEDISIRGLFPKFPPPFSEREDENKVDHIETELQALDGSLIPVSVTYVTYTEDMRYSRESAPPRFMAIFARELREEIEHREKLERDMMIAQAAANAKSDFLATMSHEMRTPLHGIVGSVELLQGSLMDPVQEHQLNNIHSCCTGLLTVIDDCLDFAKIEAKKIEFESVSFSVTDCVDSCLSMLSPEIRRRKQRVHYRVCRTSLTRVEGDPARVRQIILNIMSNAVKFNRDGASLEIGLCVSSRRPHSACDGCCLHNCPQNLAFDSCWSPELANGAFRCTTDRTPYECTKSIIFRCFVRDYGRGMTPHQVANIFEPFVQARSVGSSQGHGLFASEPGTGLGLSIINRLLNLMGGGCCVRSVATTGSCFSFWIPMDASEPGPKQQEAAPTRSLLISDDEKCRECTGSILQMYSTSVDVAEWSAEDPLSPFHRRQYSTVFLDLQPHNVITEATLDRFESLLVKPHGRICVMVSESNHDDSWTRTCRRDKVVCVLKPIDCGSVRGIAEQSAGIRNDKRAYLVRSCPAGPQSDVRILMVEDNALNRIVLFQMLQAIGVSRDSIMQAEDGVQALEICQQHAFDVVLMDIHMPRLSGWEAARRIRLNAKKYRVGCIIALTAASTLSDRDQSLKCMDFFVTKPLRMGTLISVLNSACTRIGIRRTFERAARRLSEPQHPVALSAVPPSQPSLSRFQLLQITLILACFFVCSWGRFYP